MRKLFFLVLIIALTTVYNAEAQKKTIEVLTSEIQKKPTDSSLYQERAVLYGERNDFVKVLEDFNKAIALEPNNPIYYAQRSKIYLYLGMLQDDLNDCNQAVLLDPTNEVYYSNRAVSYSLLGEFEKALSDLKVVFSKRNIPNEADYYWRGVAYFNTGKNDEAIADFTNSIKINPNYSHPYNARGFAYCELGKYQEAIDDFTQVIRLAPDADAYENRAVTYQDLAYQASDARQKADYQKKADADFAMVKKLEGSR